MRVLITGGTGFIGSRLAEALLKLGCDVWVTGSSGENRLPKEVVVFEPSLLGVDWARMARVLSGWQIDVLFHLAANNDTTVTDFEGIYWANVHAALGTFERVYSMGCRKVIYASSTAVYGNNAAPFKEDDELDPLNAYGDSKAMLESIATKYAQHHGMTAVGLRYCNVYGPGEGRKGKRASMIYQLAQQMRDGQQPMLFGDGEQKRDYIFVDDVVRANILAMELNETCVLNCGSGMATTFNELVRILRTTIPMEACEWDEPLYKPNPHLGKYQNHTECDMTLAKEILGFVPKYGISQGIQEYYERGGL